MAKETKNPMIIVLILVIISAIFAYFAYSAYEGYRNVDCIGITCNEGEFCQENKCTAIYPRV
jgi:hypothetical protein